MGISLDVVVPHRLGRASARARVDERLPEIADALPAFVERPEGSWRSDVFEFRFAAFGQRVSGQIVVLDTAIEIKADLPFIALGFRRIIAEAVRSRCEAILSDADKRGGRNPADPA